MTTYPDSLSTRPALEPLVWLACLLGPLAALAAVDAAEPPGITWADLGTWLDATSPETALAGMAGAAVRAAAVWVLASTVVAGAAVMWGRPRLTAAALRLAAPMVRRLAVATAARLAAATLAVTPTIAPAAAATVPAAPATPRMASDEPDRPLPPFLIRPSSDDPPLPVQVEQVPAAPDSSSGVVPPFLDDGQRPGAESRPPARRPADADPTTYTVASGDHLWSIARRRLAATTDGEPDQGALARYWLQVVAANRHRIRSGDPDLIFPGEVLRLPAVGGD